MIEAALDNWLSRSMPSVHVQISKFQATSRTYVLPEQSSRLANQ